MENDEYLLKQIKYIARQPNDWLVGFSSEPLRRSNGEWVNDNSDVVVRLHDHDYFSNINCSDSSPWIVENPDEPFMEIYTNPSLGKSIFPEVVDDELCGDSVRNVKHYFGIFGLEVETVLRNFIPKFQDAYIGHRVASAVEYLLRSPEKNGIEDVKKAHRNLEQAIEHYENRGAGIL